MHDPIGAFLRIRELYLRYLETAFKIRDTEISNERRTLLEGEIAGQREALCTSPLVEPLAAYTAAYPIERLLASQGADDPLAGFGGAARRSFVELVDRSRSFYT